MFDTVYALYVNHRWVRIIYGIGFGLFWAIWASTSLTAPEASVTWLVFGWLPAVFWPVEVLVWIWLHGLEPALLWAVQQLHIPGY
jgi:hypothetical protein